MCCQSGCLCKYRCLLLHSRTGFACAALTPGALQIDGQNVAVEVDGSHHYSNSLPRVPLSEVVVRRRMLQDRGWKVVNVGYMDWEALPQDASTRAAALLQLLSTQLGPADSWQRVGAPSRAPGSLVADAEAAQAAAAAQQRQLLLHQQRDMLLHGWRAPGSGFVPALAAGLSAAAGFDLGAAVCNQGSWGAVVNNAAVNPSAGFSAWGQAQEGLGMLSMPGGLGVWGSGALAAGSTGLDASGPSLLQQLTQLQQQLQQQQAWDAFMAAEGAAAGAGRGEGVASCAADGAASLPPSPASCVQQEGSDAGEAAGPDALPGAEELRAALAAAQQRWNSSPSSTQGSGDSGSKKAAAFMWGDPTLASIWA